ncbi:hypothetical protein LCGC14_1776780, partial [marine sediment metagenome]
MAHYFRNEIVAQAKTLALAGYSTRKAALELERLFPGEDTPSHPTLVEWRKEPSDQPAPLPIVKRPDEVTAGGNGKITPGKYHHFPRDFDQETYRRALELIEESVNVARALRALKPELEAQGKPVPSYATLWKWAGRNEGMLKQLQASKKEEIIAVSGEVALAVSDALLESGYEAMTPYQLAIIYGIAMDKRIGWENTGKKPAQMNVLFNLVT